MSAEEKVDSASDSSSAPSGGGNKLIIIFTLVNLVVTLGMVAVLFISFQRDKKAPQITDINAHSEESVEEEKGGHGEGGHGGEGEHGEGGHGEGKASAKKKGGVDFGKMVTLEQFTVNLSTPGSVNPKFIRVNIALEVPTGDAENEVTQKMPQVRNAIIDLFNSKRPSDLTTSESRDYLKEEIRNALNSFMVSGKVKGVFFTNFAVTS